MLTSTPPVVRALVLLSSLASVAASARAQSVAEVAGVIEAPRCEAVEIEGASAPLAEDGSFRTRVPIDEAAYATARCGWRLPLFLAPGDSLHVTVAASGEVAYAGRGAAPNRYLARTGGLVGRPFMRALFPLRRAPVAAFAAAWDSLRQADERALDALLDSAAVPAPFEALERARIRSVWAHGHLAHGVLHWRDGDAPAIRPVPASVVAAVDLADARLLALPEFQDAARALVHERARALLRDSAAYQSGDNQWLRAKYDWTVATVTDPAVRDALLTDALATHLDQNGSEGVEPLLARFAADASDPERLREVVRAYAEERRYWAGDRAETYKAVEGTTLEAHLERPAGADPDARLPAFVWLHGGSFDTGAWYHCPFVCGAARDEGMAVVRLEQRSADRFQATPADQLADVRDALAWIRRNADRLRIDPDRVVLGGFSSGATLAVMASVLDEGDVPPEAAPDAAVAVAACVAPLDGDGWFGASIAQTGDDPARYSPADQVRPGAAPLLILHGTEDEYCEWAPVGPFRDAMAAAGNDVEVEALEGQPHFFLFRSPPSRTRALGAMRAFLRARGFAGDATG